MRAFVRSILIGALWVAFLPGSSFAQDATTSSNRRPLLLTHYMPWHESRPHSGRWGWHWTMNHFDPDQANGEERSIASHFTPLAGAYDSGDLDLVEYHLQLMKLSGIDGVIIDWYGLSNLNDYGALHRNTSLMVQVADRMGMRVLICYEDQTLPPLVKAGRLQKEQQVAHAVKELTWVLDHWSKLDGYVRLDDRPVLLSFGNVGLSNDEWTETIRRLPQPVAYFSEHHRRVGAVGAFDWPIPDLGVKRVESFSEKSREWPHAIPVVFPRFVDIYKEAGVSDGYVEIPDSGGATFQKTLTEAFATKRPIIQIATWNDWGEGTVIEPSKEFEYRDLETIQRTIKERFSTAMPYQATDLRLPLRLYRLRKSMSVSSARLNQVAASLASGDTALARKQLDFLEAKRRTSADESDRSKR